jgi:hypothetical protein
MTSFYSESQKEEIKLFIGKIFVRNSERSWNNNRLTFKSSRTPEVYATQVGEGTCHCAYKE